MANTAIPSLSPTLNIPNDQTQFLNMGPGVIWTGNNIRTKPRYFPDYGDKDEFPNDGGITNYTNTNIFSTEWEEGLKVSYDGGKHHSVNIEYYGEERWMPASVYNGHGFMLYNNSDKNNATFLSRYSLVFAHRTEEWWRNYGVRYTSTPSTGYKYLRLSSDNPSDLSRINEIRGFGKDWLFQGFTFNVQTGGGVGSVASSTWIYNLRVGHKYSNTNSNLRVIPNGKRSYGHRDRSPTTFTDPYS